MSKFKPNYVQIMSEFPPHTVRLNWPVILTFK